MLRLKDLRLKIVITAECNKLKPSILCLASISVKTPTMAKIGIV